MVSGQSGRNRLNPGAPETYPRRVLLAVSGLTPQILTETLFALAVKAKPEFVPTEIHLITTLEGAERARLQLLHPETGKLHAFEREYGLQGCIEFPESNIHVIEDATGRPIRDLRDPQDNVRAGDTISQWIVEFTHDRNSALHVSIAGGRKTMGFYAGYALSLFGRLQDRMSHVLVPDRFESLRDFFYPTKTPTVLYDRDNKPIDSSEAVVMLADIPFVRLRAGLPKRMLGGEMMFATAVHVAQNALQAPSAVVDLRAKRVICAGRDLDLKERKPLAFYAWFLWRTSVGRASFSLRDRRDAGEFEAAAFYEMFAKNPTEAHAYAERLAVNGYKPLDLQENVSMVKSALIKMFGEIGAPQYAIGHKGKRGSATYESQLAPEAITVIGFNAGHFERRVAALSKLRASYQPGPA